MTYIITSLIELADHESNFSGLTWQNDVVLEPSIIPVGTSNFKAAVVESFMLDEEVDFKRHFRF